MAKKAVCLILIAYAFNAIGYLPHTLFWADYIVRELKMSLGTGGFFWAIFGVGAAIGPLFTGNLGDKFGFKRILVFAFFLKATGVILAIVGDNVLCLFASSLLVGMFTPGIVTLVSTYTLDCVGAKFHRQYWSRMTFSFSASQAIVGYLMVHVASTLDSYKPLFVFSALILLLSILCICLIPNKNKKLPNLQIKE